MSEQFTKSLAAAAFELATSWIEAARDQFNDQYEQANQEIHDPTYYSPEVRPAKREKAIASVKIGQGWDT